MEHDRYRALLAPLRARQQEAGTVRDYAPATEDQLRVTEARLGFALPPALRALYALVANGGDIFRDGWPLYGCVGGYPQRQGRDGDSAGDEGTDWFGDGDRDGEQTIDQRVSRSGWRLNARVDAVLQRNPDVYVQCEDVPDRFVCLAYLGCSVHLELDGWTGRLYSTDCGENAQSYWVGQGLAPPPGSEDTYLVTVHFFAPSVEAWIDRMLERGQMTYARLAPGRALTREILDAVSS